MATPPKDSINRSKDEINALSPSDTKPAASAASANCQLPATDPSKNDQNERGTPDAPDSHKSTSQTQRTALRDESNDSNKSNEANDSNISSDSSHTQDKSNETTPQFQFVPPIPVPLPHSVEVHEALQNSPNSPNCWKRKGLDDTGRRKTRRGTEEDTSGTILLEGNFSAPSAPSALSPSAPSNPSALTAAAALAAVPVYSGENNESISTLEQYQHPQFEDAGEVKHEEGQHLQDLSPNNGEPIEIPEAFLVEEQPPPQPETVYLLVRDSNISEGDEGGQEEVITVPAQLVKPWWKRPKILCLLFIFVLTTVLLITCASIFLSNKRREARTQQTQPQQPHQHPSLPPSLRPVDDTVISETPSSSPSITPSLDPRPTLEMVRSRGILRCGVLEQHSVTIFVDFLMDLCRAIAAAVLEDPGGTQRVITTDASRFDDLHGNQFDVLLSADTHTLLKEMQHEIAFSTPFCYLDVKYLGLHPFVNCADHKDTSRDCSNLTICITNSTTDRGLREFSPQYYRMASNFEDTINMLRNGTCNVSVVGLNKILTPGVKDAIRADNCVFGNRTLAADALAIVTRKEDVQWSDIMDWVMNSMIYGMKYAIGKDMYECLRNDNRFPNALGLNFYMAIRCIGNYDEIFDEHARNGLTFSKMNGINEGTPMIYSPPFGDLFESTDEWRSPEPDSTFGEITSRGQLNCGVVNFRCDLTNVTSEEEALSCMGEAYCNAIAAAIFHGHGDAINLVTVGEGADSLPPLEALSNGEIDVLAGGRIDIKSDIHGISDEGDKGFTFSTPYYYTDARNGSDGIDAIALVTREDDTFFSSFVSSVVSATIYASRKGITKDTSHEMPSCPLYGRHLDSAFKNAVGSGGNYDEIYETTHMRSNGSIFERGRNRVNLDYGPQLFPYPLTVERIVRFEEIQEQ